MKSLFLACAALLLASPVNLHAEDFAAERAQVLALGQLTNPPAMQPAAGYTNEAGILSDGSRFLPNNNLPRFTWEVTPQYFMFGDGDRLLRPEEVSSIAARTGFLCIEKSHGFKELGAAELGAKHEAAAFKKIKPGIKVLFYFNSADAWPFTSYNQGFTPETIDQHPELKKFLLVDPATGKLANCSNVYHFDVLNPAFREWWVNTVAKGVAVSGCDGAFIDQMHGFAWLRKDKSEDVEKAMGEMMASLKKKLGPNKILLGNNAADKMARYVFPVVDAIMFEHYSPELLRKEKLLQDWDEMLRIAKAGKASIFRIGVEQDSKWIENSAQKGTAHNKSEMIAELAKERLEFYLACYLIGAQPYSYFQYGWGWDLSDGSLKSYPELHKPLGAPKGPYTRTEPAGWQFTREFAHASVWVDLANKQARIDWHSSSPTTHSQ